MRIGRRIGGHLEGLPPDAGVGPGEAVVIAPRDALLAAARGMLAD